jgi:hypothetical protein
MSDIFIKGQIPLVGSFLGGVSPRSTGPVTEANPLQVGEIIKTTLGERGKVTFVSGTRATIQLEYSQNTFSVQSSGTSGTDFSLWY